MMRSDGRLSALQTTPASGAFVHRRVAMATGPPSKVESVSYEGVRWKNARPDDGGCGGTRREWRRAGSRAPTTADKITDKIAMLNAGWNLLKCGGDGL